MFPRFVGFVRAFDPAGIPSATRRRPRLPPSPRSKGSRRHFPPDPLPSREARVGKAWVGARLKTPWVGVLPAIFRQVAEGVGGQRKGGRGEEK